MKFMIYIIFIFSAIFSQCPEGFVLDDCQECWQPYCYCLSNHIPNFDISQSDCENDGCWWIGPGGDYEPGDYEFCLFNPEWTLPGSYIFNWDASNYQTGIYILKVSSGQNIETQLINFIK